jgi:carnitine O-acetyltransferase
MSILLIFSCFCSLQKTPLAESPYQGGPIQPLTCHVPDTLIAVFNKARIEFDALCAAHDFTVLKVSTFGKNLLKGHHVSPDAFLQLAFQLAYYNMTGTLVATYESTQTRAFLYGRTEVTRSCSVGALRWVKAMQPASRDPLHYKLHLLQEALRSHSNYMRDAAKGEGIDRHLLALKRLVAPQELPPVLFSDEAFTRTAHWTLSTSHLASPHYACWGWGPVVPEGLGIPYTILPDSLIISISSHAQKSGEASKARRFSEYLEEALHTMHALLRDSEASKL